MESGAWVGDDELLARVANEKIKRDIDVDEAEINVCFSTTDGWLSLWIRKYTGAPVSHALITFRSKTLNRVVVMQASGHGYQIVPWSKWEKQNILVARYKFVTPSSEQLLAGFA